MEKYGVEQDLFEVVVKTASGDEVIGEGLSLEVATSLQKKNPKSTIRPE